ncbi:MAG: DUF2953 domain-containing protein [Clostridiales bacterium]|jgi:hypothetical protein|nr:DUF2953 domain-containing protein [Bacillota bacterium]NLK03341.1 DUF2953 domain-containing protein [Clostridiales bacterium]
MLSVILTILKLIGITILILLGLILLILLLVLFIPIRYKIKIEHGDAFALNGHASWLLHILHVGVKQSDKKPRISIRIFGFLLFDSQGPSKPKKAKPRREAKERVKRKKEKAQKLDDIKNVEEIQNNESEDLSKDKMIFDDNANKLQENFKAKDQETSHSEKPNNDKLKSEGKTIRFFKRIKEKLMGLLRRIKNKIISMIQRLIAIKHKGALIIDFIRNDVNKEGFRFTYKSLIKLLKHLLPRKLESNLIFGTGDPCSTGQALGGFALLYSFYGDKLQITPDFENKVFKGKHYARGRIRIWTLLIIIIKLLLDKRFKELKTNFQLLKEAL